MWKRFQDRKRHPGHVDSAMVDEMKPILLKGKENPIDVNSIVIEVDTTYFEKVDYQGIYNQIRKYLS